MYEFDYTLIYRVYQFTPSLSDKLTVLGATNLSLLVFTFAVLKFGNAPYSKVKQLPILAKDKDNYRSPLVLTWAIIGPFAILSLFYTLSWSTSDTFDMVFDREAGTYINTSGNGYFSDAQIMLIPLVVATVWIGRFNWKYLVLAFSYIAVQSFTGTRWQIIVTAFSIALLYLYDRRIRWVKAYMIAPLLGLWLAFGLLSIDRGMYFRQLAGLETSRSINVDRKPQNLRFLESMDYGNLEFFELIVYAVPQRTQSYDYFAEHLQVFTEPIPRVLWANKPRGAPVKFFRLDDYVPVFSFTKSVGGAGWFALGWIGVVIWSAAFGAAYGLAYSKWTRSKTVFATLAYVVFLSLAMQLFRDGLLVSIAKMGGFALIPLLLMRFLKNFFRLGLNQDQVRFESAGIGRGSGAVALPAAVRRRRAALAAPPQQT